MAKVRHDIVLITDSRAQTALVEEALAGDPEHGFRLSTAAGVREGMRLLRERSADLLLLDLDLPDSTGLEALARIVMEFPDVAAVVLTGLGDSTLADRAISMGAQDFLSKRELGGALLVRSMRYSIGRKKAEIELRKANEELERYGHMVSHDLRSPLGAISMACELLADLEGGSPDEIRSEVADVASSVKRSVAKCNRLIDDLLALARAGQPRGAYDVDVSVVLATIVEEKAEEIRRRRAVIRADRELGSLRAYEAHVYQLFGNLIANAVRHSERERPVVEIRALAPIRPGERRYLVRDNGRGFPLKRLEELSRPLAKSKEEGTGLGLPIIRKIIDIYRGELRVYNDDGACFEFSLADVG